MPDAIQLSPEDTRDGLKLWLECERTHEQQHAAEAVFGRWADAMARIYGVSGDYVIGDPTRGFLPKPEVTGD